MCIVSLMIFYSLTSLSIALHWRHNDDDGVSNHQPHGCLLNRLFGRWSKKTSKLRVTGLCAGNSPGHVNSPHKGPVTRKMFPFDDVIMGNVNRHAALQSKQTLHLFKTFEFKFQVQITLLLYETSNSLQLQNALHMEHNTELQFVQHSSTKQ